METYFVVRDTYHPEEDLKRNWSATMSGHSVADLIGDEFSTKEEAIEAYTDFGQGYKDFRYHPAHNSFVPVHYEGLGAWMLDAETLEEALVEAAGFGDDLACTSESGNGHFYAQDCVSFHQVRKGKYVFEIKY